MYWIGVDHHKRTSYVTLLAPDIVETILDQCGPEFVPSSMLFSSAFHEASQQHYELRRHYGLRETTA
jgi:hypothetical protein